MANKIRQLNETSSSPWKESVKTEQALLDNDGFSNPKAFSKQLLVRKQEQAVPKPAQKKSEKTKNAIQQTTNKNSTVKMNIQEETQISV